MILRLLPVLECLFFMKNHELRKKSCLELAWAWTQWFQAARHSRLASPWKSGYTHDNVKARRYSSIKAAEARDRSVVKASRGTRSATRQQRRVSLAGGVNWRITNWGQVADAFAKWA